MALEKPVKRQNIRDARERRSKVHGIRRGQAEGKALKIPGKSSLAI